MSKTESEVPTLASRWFPPEDAGEPLVCIASTYTFHASYLESELLPRFLGQRFDNTEKEGPFVIEREEALQKMTCACVLVDQPHVDHRQTTLRWDQLPVRVPNGAQHAKVVLLLWERRLRLLVSSANLTESGYLTNREMAGVLDFFDDDSSAPRVLATDAIDFLGIMAGWVSAANGSLERFRKGLAEARQRLESWQHMRLNFGQRGDYPRATFVAGLPMRDGHEQSVLQETLDLWGNNRKATKVIVMTPFVGETGETHDPVIDRLKEVRGRDTIGSLIVPGGPSGSDPDKQQVNLPRRFRNAWASAWGIEPQDVTTYIVPRRRGTEKKEKERNLHAKAVYLEADDRTLLLCGSSNFSPHGMGVGVFNIEANLCYIDQTDVKRGGLKLWERLPVDWEADECSNPDWPDDVACSEEEQTAGVWLPQVFQWAAYDQRGSKLTIKLDPNETLPAEWSIRLPGGGAVALAHSGMTIPPDGIIVIPLHEQSIPITCLSVSWVDEKGRHSAFLPVQVNSAADLLPPEEFRGLTVDRILDCLVSGRSLAELAEQAEDQNPGKNTSPDAALDSLRSVDTSGYLLYRVRRLGRALAGLGEKLLRTVRTKEAVRYRLQQDPLGPCRLAEAIRSQWEQETDPAPVLFCLAEIALTVAHAGRRLHKLREKGEPDLRPLFAEAVAAIRGQGQALQEQHTPASGLGTYLKDVVLKCEELVGTPKQGENHAD